MAAKKKPAPPPKVKAPPPTPKVRKRPAFKHLVSEAVVPAACIHCRSKVLYGLDGGVPLALDAGPIGAEEEIKCVMNGWLTWDIVGDGTARERDMTHYALPRKYPVHRGHYCGPNGSPAFPRVRLGK